MRATQPNPIYLDVPLPHSADASLGQFSYFLWQIPLEFLDLLRKYLYEKSSKVRGGRQVCQGEGVKRWEDAMLLSVVVPADAVQLCVVLM